jgi:hypothetical protein
MNNQALLRVDLVQRLKEVQLPDGSFVGTRWKNGIQDQGPVRLPMVCTAWIVIWLEEIATSPEERQIVEKALEFLDGRQVSKGGWSFDGSDSLPDLDTTMVVLRALSSRGINGSHVAVIANMLTSHEVDEGGPYRSSFEDQNLDPAVNLNVALCLRTQDVELENLDAYLGASLEARTPSRRYLSDDFFSYLFACWSRNKKQQDDALDRFARTPSSQPFVRDWEQADEVWYGGSALSAAAALMRTAKCTIFESDQVERGNVVTHIAKQVDAYWEQRISLLPLGIQDATKELFRLIRDEDAENAIAGLPALFVEAFDVSKVSEEMLVRLGVATVAGWMAYTVYDDILDDESDPRQLSAANIAFREMVRMFTELGVELDGFATKFHEVMDRIDAANQWEVTHCRAMIDDDSLMIDHLPDYGDGSCLAERSLGHALAALAILMSKGGVSLVEIEAVERWFIGYLAARQMNDDAHDWEEDLRRGHLNSVGVCILHAWQEEHGRSTEGAQRISLSAIPEMRELFWKKILPLVSERVLTLTATAREAMTCSVFVHSPRLEKMLQSVERPAQKAIDDHRESQRFVEVFTRIQD